MSDTEADPVTRRQVLAAGLAGAATGLLAGAASESAADAAQPLPGQKQLRMPTAFLPHGGGPWPFVPLGFGTAEEQQKLAAYLRSVRHLPMQTPKALLVVSAHWEERLPTVITAAHPPMYYDYYGFPPASYAIQWPAPGHPAVAARVRQLLGAAGFATAANADRGFDHGTFVPLKLTYPAAEVPVVQLSLKAGLDPQEHLAMGRALAPLRDEGVFIIGSGMTFHNLRTFGSPAAATVAAEFDAWLRVAATGLAADRDASLLRWAEAPAAKQAHPREEHLLPLLVIAGAAGADRGALAYQGTFAGAQLSAYHFG